MARRINEIKEQLYEGAFRRQEANYFGPGSILDGLASDVAALVFEAEMNQENIIGAVHVDSANVAQIDRFARDFNLQRRPAERAYSYDSDRNVVISTTTGESLSSVLALNNIVLPGLRVSDASGKKVYVVEVSTGSLSLPSCYVTVKAILPGEGYNVNKNELRRFEKDYARLKITNNFSITNGRDGEGAGELKDRIFLKIESNTRNANALNSIISQLSEYGKYSVIRNYDGPNSLLICIQPSSGLFYQESTIRDIQAKLSMFMGSGVKLKVSNFSPVVFNFKTKIVCQPNTIPMQVAASVKEAIINFFNTFVGTDSVSLLELNDYVRRAVPGLKMISRVGAGFQEVTYTVLEGSSSFTHPARDMNVVTIGNNQVATIGSIIINVEA